MSNLGRSRGMFALAVLTLTVALAAPAFAQVNAIKDAWLVMKIHSEFVDEDVLYGSLLGQTALVLSLVVFRVRSLAQRLRAFPIWQQSFVLLVVYGIAQLLALWLNALAGSRPPTLVFLTPSLVSALLWPWIYLLLRGLRLRFGVN